MMKRLRTSLLYGTLTLALLVGVCTLVWAAIPAGFYVQYTGSDTITLPAGVTFNAPTVNITSAFTSASSTAMSGVISPSQITANQNDYNPTGLSTASVLRLSTDAARNITGLAGGAAGRLVLIHNVGIQNLVLISESTSSTAATRFEFPGDLTLIPKAMVLLQYDGTSLRWHTSYPSLTAGPVSASFVDYVIQSVDPSPPGTGVLRDYAKAGGKFTRDSAGNIVGPFGTGGGGGSGAGFVIARVATTTNIALTAEQTIDGITTNNSVVLVKNQNTLAENGPYTSSSSGWSRLAAFDTTAEFTNGLSVYVMDGTSITGNKETVWHFAPPVAGFTLNTTAMTFMKTGPGPTGELIANKSTVVTPVANGYIGADANGRAAYNRLGSTAVHASGALSVGSTITPAALETGIEGSGGPIDLTSSPQIAAGIDGQLLFLPGIHASNTVKLDNGTGTRLCGNTGSTLVGLDGEKPLFRYNNGLGVWEELICPSLQKAYNSGRTIIGATNLASAVQICDTANGNCTNIYGSTIQGTNAGAVIDITNNIPAAKNYILQGNGTEFERMTVAGVHSFSNAGKPRKAIYFPASAISTDGSNCTTPAEVTIGSGPKQFVFTCANSTSSIFYLSVSMFNTGWDAGAVRATLHASHASTETINFSGTFAAQCHGDAEVIDSTFGTGVTTTVAITTANRYERQESADITPAGTCAPGDFLWLKYTRTTSEANSTNIRILGITLSYLVSTRNGAQE